MSSDSFRLGLRTSLNSSLAAESLPQKTAAVPSDNDLIVMVQRGNEEAFGQLFDRYYVVIRSVARKILRNPEDIDDVIQETFMDVFQGARSYDPARGKLKTWISYLAYHRSVKRVRFLKKRMWQTCDSDETSSVLDPEITPDEWIRSLDFGRSLKFVVGTLNEKQRKTMVLHFFDGLEVETIAAALGETVGNTRNHLYRGLANLRSRLMQNQLLAGYIEFAESEIKGKVRR